MKKTSKEFKTLIEIEELLQLTKNLKRVYRLQERPVDADYSRGMFNTKDVLNAIDSLSLVKMSLLRLIKKDKEYLNLQDYIKNKSWKDIHIAEDRKLSHREELKYIINRVENTLCLLKKREDINNESIYIITTLTDSLNWLNLDLQLMLKLNKNESR